MADVTARLTRAKLSQFLPNLEAIQAWESFQNNAVASLPDIILVIQQMIAALTVAINDAEINSAFSEKANSSIGNILSSISDIQTGIDSVASSASSNIAELSKLVNDLQIEISLLPNMTALLAETRKTSASYSGTLNLFAPTTSAQLASVITDETGTGKLVFGTSPTMTTPDIIGTVLANNANAGSEGEYLTANAAGVVLTSGTPTNIVSRSLPPGDYLVFGNILYQPAATTTTQVTLSGFNTVSATFPAIPMYSQSGAQVVAGLNTSSMPPFTRINVSVTTTINLVGQANFSVSTMSASGNIFALRIR